MWYDDGDGKRMAGDVCSGRTGRDMAGWGRRQRGVGQTVEEGPVSHGRPRRMGGRDVISDSAPGVLSSVLVGCELTTGAHGIRLASQRPYTPA